MAVYFLLKTFCFLVCVYKWTIIYMFNSMTGIQHTQKLNQGMFSRAVRMYFFSYFFVFIQLYSYRVHIALLIRSIVCFFTITQPFTDHVSLPE